MPLPGRSPRCAASQASRARGRGSRSTPSRSDVAGQRAAHRGRPRARRRRAARRRRRPPARWRSRSWPAPGAGGQRGEQVADAAVVGPEVVAPVADAVRLVDDQQPAPARPARAAARRGTAGCSSRSGLTSRTSTSSAASARVDVVPLVDVGGVDRHRPDAGPGGGGDLVAHEREQRARRSASGPAPAARSSAVATK